MNKKDILIVCALEMETQNQLDDYEVLYTGVGKVNATYYLTSYLNRNLGWYSGKPKLIINFGTAGAKVYNGLVDCTRFIQRDMDATPLGFNKGETPFESEPSMIDFTHIKNLIGKHLTCYTGDTFETKIGLYDDVVDMESYALAKTCRNLDIDFVSYKYISDDGNADDWEKNCSKGVEVFKKVLEYYDNL